MPLEIGNSFVNKQAGLYLPHLWIIISHPSINPEQIAIVNITSWRDKAIGLNDSSCIVSKGEHKFVTKKSYIFYREAQLTSAEKLQTAIDGGVLVLQDNCTKDLLDKILAGAAQSPFTPIGIIEILRQQELI